MNIWDILENIELFDVKLSKIVNRAVLIGMVAFPASFGGWMMCQAIHREQATASYFAQPMVNMINKTMTSPIMQSPATAAPAPDPMKPVVLGKYPAIKGTVN